MKNAIFAAILLLSFVTALILMVSYVRDNPKFHKQPNIGALNPATGRIEYEQSPIYGTGDIAADAHFVADTCTITFLPEKLEGGKRSRQRIEFSNGAVYSLVSRKQKPTEGELNYFQFVCSNRKGKWLVKWETKRDVWRSIKHVTQISPI
jgi:hypothetical protein